MMKPFQYIFLVVFVFTSQVFSQQFSVGSPEWLVDMFFSKSSFTEKANYYSGEMLNESDKPTIGEELNGKGEISFHQIRAGDDKIVFAIELKSAGKIIDFYCFIKKSDNTWKIYAIRRFLLPPFIYQAYDSVSKLNSPSISDANLTRTLSLFTMNDSSLKNFASTNLNSLNELVLNFQQMDNERVDAQLKSLGCSAVFKDNKYPDCIFIQINSIDRMEAGFIYAPADAQLPSVSDEEFIYLEEVLPHWFIYRVM